MKITITIDNQHHEYEAYLVNVPSSASLFTRLQYRGAIDGERHAIAKDVKAILELRQLTFKPIDPAATITINRKAYRLPAIEAQESGFSYIKAQYGEAFTDAAKAQLERQIKPVINEFCTSYFNTMKKQALQSYKTRLHEIADFVTRQVQQMRVNVDALT